MKELSLFDGIDVSDISKMIKCFNGEKIICKKDQIILSNVFNSDLIGILLSGSACLVRYDYNGNKTIIEVLENNSVFGKNFSYLDSETYVVAITDCEVLFLNYLLLMNCCKNNCTAHNILIDNIFDLLTQKIADLNERVEVLSKRSIRDKLLTYLNLVADKKGKKSFYLPFTYTDLADYLSIDRSAMMREIKNLKDEGFISSNGKKITINVWKEKKVLLGATGTDKTFTIANVIKEVNKPTLVLAHNKTLAGQLYSELKEIFPGNHVCYFVSYYNDNLKSVIFGIV